VKSNAKNEINVMADRSSFWQMVDRTKPDKLRVFAQSELRDCQDYFLEIQSDSTLPSSVIITASERLALIRSEIDLRHSDAKHRQTQRLARWAIGIGIVGILSAVVAIVFGIANRPTPQHVPAAATEAAQTPAVIPPTPATLPMTTPTPAASPTMSVVSTRTPTTQQKKTRRTRRSARHHRLVFGIDSLNLSQRDSLLEMLKCTLSSWGCVSAIDSNRRTIWIADAHREDGKRFVARADEMLTALVELESVIRVACRWYFSRVACYSPPLHSAVHILCKKHTLIRGSDVPM
jgi:hypothetical protein